jgi:hypothetical protein
MTPVSRLRCCLNSVQLRARPLGWHVPPEQFAPDSSESESDGHVRTRLLGQHAATRAPEPRLEMILRLGMLTEEPGSDVPVRFGFGRVGRIRIS